MTSEPQVSRGSGADILKVPRVNPEQAAPVRTAAYVKPRAFETPDSGPSAGTTPDEDRGVCIARNNPRYKTANSSGVKPLTSSICVGGQAECDKSLSGRNPAEVPRRTPITETTTEKPANAFLAKPQVASRFGAKERMEVSLATDQAGTLQPTATSESTVATGDDNSATPPVIPELAIPATAAVSAKPRPEGMLIAEQGVTHEPIAGFNAAVRRYVATNGSGPTPNSGSSLGATRPEIRKSTTSFRPWLSAENAPTRVRERGKNKYLGVAAEVPVAKAPVEKERGTEEPSPLVSGKRNLSNLAQPSKKRRSHYR